MKTYRLGDPGAMRDAQRDWEARNDEPDEPTPDPDGPDILCWWWQAQINKARAAMLTGKQP